MQNRDKASLEREAHIVTEAQVRKLVDDQIYTARAEIDRAREQRARDEYNDDEIAIKNADANGNDSDTLRYKGRFVKGNRAHHRQTLQEKDPHGIKALMGGLMETGAVLASLQHWAQSMTSLTGRFGVKAAETKAAHFYEDEFNIYEQQRVSQQAYAVLMGELAAVRAREEALQDISDPELYMEELQDFAEYVNSLDMRPHPLTGQFLHSIARVEEEEMKCAIGPDQSAMCTIPVFRPKAKIVYDSRGVKILVGDQFDQDPTETIGEVKQGPAPAIPVAIPTFDIS